MTTINIGVQYDGREVVFHLREISVAEENRYSARFLSIPDRESDERKAEMEYDIFVDAISSWSQDPVTVRDANGTETPLYADAATPAESVRMFFEERTPINERIAPTLIGKYRMKLQPDVVFY